VFVSAEPETAARHGQSEDFLTRLEEYTGATAVASCLDVAGVLSLHLGLCSSNYVHLYRTRLVIPGSAAQRLQGVLVCEFLAHGEEPQHSHLGRMDGEIGRPVAGEQLLLYFVDLGDRHLQCGRETNFVIGSCGEKEGEGLHSIIALLLFP